MNLFYFCFSVIVVLSLYFLNVHSEDFKERPTTRYIVDSKPKKVIATDGKSSVSEDGLWKPVSFFKTSPTLYQFIENPGILIRTQKGKGISIQQVPDLHRFFNQEENKKTIILSKTSIKDRKVSFSRIESLKDIAVFYLKGTYIDFKKRKVFFEEWNFYHKEISLKYVIVHSAPVLTEKESQSVYNFIYNRVNSESSLTVEERASFHLLMERIKGNGN